jgi:hypothetical protein
LEKNNPSQLNGYSYVIKNDQKTITEKLNDNQLKVIVSGDNDSGFSYIQIKQ